ncbi:MAG: hypothetical protein Q9159_000438 [Coniocarpon cinnabarinum]
MATVAESPSNSRPPTPPPKDVPPPPPPKPQWLLWALGSGAFAATNGVFAKLTTADTTHNLSHRFFADSPIFELALRALFFGLNLLSNAIMWILFTRALTAASSTTRVSVLNTSANFLVTAVYGLLVFGEGFNWEWGVGAMLLVGGCVVIGRREGGETAESKGSNVGPVDGEGAIRLSGEERRGDARGRESDEYNDRQEGLVEVDADEEREERRKEREIWDRTD